MKKITRLTLTSVGFFIACSAIAAPVHLDMPEAHIIVNRPIDRWTAAGGVGVMWTREFQPVLWGMKPQPAVSPVWLYSSYFGDSSRKSDLDSDVALMKAVRAGILTPRYKAYQSSGSFKFFIRDDIVNMTPAQANEFSLNKSATFVASVAGDAFGTSAKENFSVLQTIAGLALNVAINMKSVSMLDGSRLPVGGVGLGAGNIATDNSGLSASLMGLANDNRSITPPIDFDFTPYQSVQYRLIELLTNEKIFGDLYIAYKVEKTPELEVEMQAKAILLAMGMGATTEEVSKAVADEVALREKIRSSSSATAITK